MLQLCIFKRERLINIDKRNKKEVDTYQNNKIIDLLNIILGPCFFLSFNI